MHKRADGVHKAPFNIDTAARAWAARVRQRPGARAIKPPRRACVQARAPTPPPNQEGIGEGGGKTPRGFQSYVYIISHPRVIPTPKGPYKTGGPLLKAASGKFQKSDKRPCCVGLACQRQTGKSSFILLFLLCCRVPGTPGRQDEHSTEVLHGQAIVQANSARRDCED